MEHEKEVTLVFTVGGNVTTPRKRESLTSDEGYGSSSPTFSAVPTLPMTISESCEESKPVPKGGRKFRLPWGNGRLTDSEQVKRREKEKQAEDYILSLAGRSLAIQLENVEKMLNKEKRRVQFGFVSSRIMDLAIRRYSYKLSELQRDVELECVFPKCAEELGFMLRHMADRLKLPPDCQKFRKVYWDLHGTHIDLRRVMFDETTDLARKRQLRLERIPRKQLRPENSDFWWSEDADGCRIPSRDHLEWICWGFTPAELEVSRICLRIARQHWPDEKTVGFYKAQAVLAA